MNNSDIPVMPTEQSTEHFSQASTDYSVGLTKREHFAGLAMQGILSNSVMGDSALHEKYEDWVKDISESSLQFADALLAELDKGVR
jgi:hypothetical protein